MNREELLLITTIEIIIPKNLANKNNARCVKRLSSLLTKYHYYQLKLLNFNINDC